MSDFENSQIDHQPIKKRSLYLFSFFLLALFIFLLFQNNRKKPLLKEKQLETVNIVQKERLLSSWDIFLSKLQERSSNYWKIPKVHNFYRDLTPIVLEQSLNTGTPPGAVLAIASLESGYGTGYIASVSGNILSLNARKDEPLLPPLTVPVTEDGDVIIHNSQIKEMLATGKKLDVSNRPPSLKKDYRPHNIAGTDDYLDYFLINPQDKFQAWEQNVIDLVFGRIKKESTVPAYRDTYNFVNKIKKSKSLKKLFSNKSAKTYLSTIGGKPHSYNIRKSWVTKCQLIIDKIEMEYFLKEYYKEFYAENIATHKWKKDFK